MTTAALPRRDAACGTVAALRAGAVAIALAAFLALAAGPAAAAPRAAAAKTPKQIAAASAAGVVGILATIQVQSRFGGVQEGIGTGSGFVINRNGDILTSEHVVEGATKVHVSFADGTKVDAKVIATDALLDLAVIRVKVPARTLRPLVIGNADTLALGEQVVAIGNPFGLDRSVSVGIVSALRRQMTAPNGFTISNSVQTDAAVNHGNSGGPLFDENGRVIGVNAQIADSGVNANVGVAYAVALDPAARKVIAQLVAGQTPKHAWLGVSLDDIDAILATSGGVGSPTGALITGIVAGGPAELAGLRGGSQIGAVDGAEYCLGGDIVTSVNGRPVLDTAALQSAIAPLAPGTKVRLGVVRAGGAKATLTLTLGTQPTAATASTTGCG